MPDRSEPILVSNKNIFSSSQVAFQGLRQPGD